jgi:hypothetical protein
MNERDWLTLSDAQPMLMWLWQRPQVSRRKVLLFGAACCRQHWGLLSPQEQQAVAMLEKALDESDPARARAKWSAAAALAAEGRVHFGRAFFAGAALAYLLAPENDDPVRKVQAVSSWAASASPTRQRELAAQAEILRDLFGPLLHRALPAGALDARYRTWNDGTVTRLAQAIHEEGAFERLPILADALEEAGCDNEEVLAHLREPRMHFRGCWIVDWLVARK